MTVNNGIGVKGQTHRESHWSLVSGDDFARFTVKSVHDFTRNVHETVRRATNDPVCAMIRRVLILGRMISWWLRIDTRYEVMKGCCVCIHVFRVIPTDRIFSTESLCTDIYIHRNYMNNLFFQRAYHIIFIRDLSDVWKLFRKSSYIATRYRDVTCHIIANCVSSFVYFVNRHDFNYYV